MKVGQTFEARVVDLSSSGQGVIKHPKGMTFFVNGVWRNELGRFEVTELKKGFGRAELVELVELSPHRRPSPCKFADQGRKSCGGCAWMPFNYESQLAEKQLRVEAAMSRIDSRWRSVVSPIIAAPDEFSYRNRAQFKSDGTELGYLSSRSHHLVDIDTCIVLNLELNSHLHTLRSRLPLQAWQPKRKAQWTTLDIDDRLAADQVSINKRMGFRQGNTAQNHAMKTWVGENVRKITAYQFADDETIEAVELFCGEGNFTEVLASIDRLKIRAAEGSQSAIDKLNGKGFSNLEAQAVDLFNPTAFNHFIRRGVSSQSKARGRIPLLLLDPPRDGLKVKDGLFDKKVAPKNILYVSCDLATFTRDSAEFKQQGYKLSMLQPIDLFPQTPHVELMGHFKKS